MSFSKAKDGTELPSIVEPPAVEERLTALGTRFVGPVELLYAWQSSERGRARRP